MVSLQKCILQSCQVCRINECQQSTFHLLIISYHTKAKSSGTVPFAPFPPHSDEPVVLMLHQSSRLQNGTLCGREQKYGATPTFSFCLCYNCYSFEIDMAHIWVGVGQATTRFQLLPLKSMAICKQQTYVQKQPLRSSKLNTNQFRIILIFIRITITDYSSLK